MTKAKKNNWCFYNFTILSFWSIIVLLAVVWIAMNAPKILDDIEQDLSTAVQTTTQDASDILTADMASSMAEFKNEINAEVADAVATGLAGLNPANVKDEAEKAAQDAYNAGEEIVSSFPDIF